MMFPSPGVLLVVTVIAIRAAAKPWQDMGYLPGDTLGGYRGQEPQDLLYGDDDQLRDVSKRFSVNSFRLFRPFYHPNQPEDTYGSFHKRGSNSLNDLILRLLALKGNSYGGKATSMRFGPGGR